MRMFLKMIFVAGAALVLGGCASAPEAPPPGAVQHIKRVAVVSTVGGTFTRTYIGATVFGNEKHVRQVPEWRLDRTYEDRIAIELKRLGYSVVNPSYPAEEFAKVNVRRMAEANWDAIGPAAKAHCTANTLDAVVVVAKWGPEGIGVYAQRAPRDWFATLFLQAQIGLFDCASAKVIAERQIADPSQQPKNFLARRPMPAMSLPEGWPWYGEWKPEIYEKARMALIELPEPVWAPLMNAFLPPAGAKKAP